MSVTIDQLVGEIGTLLKGATAAGQRVYDPDDFPTFDGQYPVILVQATKEDRESLGRASIQFTCTATILITGRVTAPGATVPQDEGATAAAAALWALKKQIEQTVINNDAIAQLGIQQYPFVRSSVGFSAAGEYHEAQLAIELGVEYYQGPEDFFPTVETVIDEVTELSPATVPAFPAIP